MLMTALLYIIVFFYGIVFGSFLNVLILRLPLKENIATERSHCMSCNHVLAWYDLFPLFSYLCLGGKCRYCKAKISKQYPIVEALNGFGYLLIFAVMHLRYGTLLDAHALSYGILISLCYSIFIVITVIDWRTYEIPFSLNVCIFVLGVIKIVAEILIDGFNGFRLLEYAIGFCAVSGFMLICLYIGRAIKSIDAFGGGDIKLMAAAGVFMGWKNIILAFIIGCVLGAIIHSIRIRVSNADKVLAFGPYLCAGILTVMLYGDTILNWYLSLMFH